MMFGLRFMLEVCGDVLAAAKSDAGNRPGRWTRGSKIYVGGLRRRAGGGRPRVTPGTDLGGGQGWRSEGVGWRRAWG
jgi:hypothetical protein